MRKPLISRLLFGAGVLIGSSMSGQLEAADRDGEGAGSSCGDVNDDGKVNIADPVYLLGWLFRGGPAPVCPSSCGDVNDDGKVNIADPVYLLGWLFRGGPDPACASSPPLPNLKLHPLECSVIVSCPGGDGTCITTVKFTIANGGPTAAGPFNVRVAMDGGGVVNVPVSGLAAGASQILTVSSPPGGKCYDPDCTICIFLDDGGTVPEIDEMDNKQCRTCAG